MAGQGWRSGGRRVANALLAIVAAAGAILPGQPGGPAIAAEPEGPTRPAAPATLELAHPLLLPRVGVYRRGLLHTDPLEAAIARGLWRAPAEGDLVAGAAWRRDPPGKPRPADAAGGYVCGAVEAPADGVWLVAAPGVAAVWIGSAADDPTAERDPAPADPEAVGGAEGAWLAGDPYATGWFRVPVLLPKGRSRVVAHLAREGGAVRLERPDAPVLLLADRAIVPDAVHGEVLLLAATLPVVNASTEALEGLRIVAEVLDEGGRVVGEPIVSLAPRIESLLCAPATLRFAAPPDAPAGTYRLRVALRRESPDEAVASTELPLRIVEPTATRVATYVSAVDGTAQPYSVVPPAERDGRGVLLTLHEAGQDHAECAAEVIQAAAAAPLTIVAPGGRGRWGFDWEDWSRRDAMDALADHIARFGDPSGPVAVAGRGLGGHGALVLSTLAPGRFALVAPIDPWVSFYTQGVSAAPLPAAAGPNQELVAAAARFDPLVSLTNLQGSGVLVQHTGPSAPSPVAESRLLRRRLAEFHDDFAYQELDGPAWPTDQSSSSTAGAWRRVIDAASERFARFTEPAATPESVRFVTPDPGSLARVGWATVERLRRYGAPAGIDLTVRREFGELVGSAPNVQSLAIDAVAFAPGAAKVIARLDEQPPLEAPLPGRSGVLRFERDSSGAWRVATDGPAWRKNPDRPGGLKSVLDRRPLLVYGTRGDEPSRRWAVAKARYDASTFFYRGAGMLEVIADQRFDPAPTDEVALDRNVVLYGDSETNSAWSAVLGRSPIRVSPGVVRVGPRPQLGDDLAVFWVGPRRGSNRATVGVIAGSGPVGARATTRMRAIWSGVETPDLVLVSAAALEPPAEGERGLGADGVLAAGYLDDKWSPLGGGVVWRDLAF